MRLTSVRARLTLWNVSIMALALLVFAAAVRLIVQHDVSASIDRDLADNGAWLASRWSYQANRFLPRPGLMPAPPMHPSDRDSRRVLDLQGHVVYPSPTAEPLDLGAVYQAAKGIPVYSTVIVDDLPYRIYSTPMGQGGVRRWVLQIRHELAPERRLLAGLTRTLLTLIPVALLVAGIGGSFLTARALRPVRQIRRAAAEIEARDLSRRLNVIGDDEFSDLASTFNSMIARLQSAFKQQQQFVADASHELRTPLTTIKGSTSLALSGERDAREYRSALETADRAADIMSRVVQDLLLLARSDSGQLDLELEPASISDILEYTLDALRGRDGPAIRMDDLDEACRVDGDEHYLIRLFVNLLDNALRHTPPDGDIAVSARRVGSSLKVSIRDTGEGISPDHLPHLGERFYRVDTARQRTLGGTGLGLAICKSIVQAHGGVLEFQSTLGKGTTVTVTLPAAFEPIVHS